ncbi:hypothetical protein GBAR_LOCUS23557, partial [Geodia barretti]
MQAVSKRMCKDMKKSNDCEAALARAGQKMASDARASSHGKTEPLKTTVSVCQSVFQFLCLCVSMCALSLQSVCLSLSLSPTV